MLPIEKIVLPTDFSDASYAALEPAVTLAKHFSAKILIVNVVSPIPVIPSANAAAAFHVPGLIKDMLEAAEKALQDVVRERMPSDVRVQHRVIQGRPAEEIINVADKEGADLIVISTHGESGLQRLISGSVTEKVVRLSECPVLTIRAHGDS